MYKDGKLIIGKITGGERDGEEIFIRPEMANRHGLITGATGTGKTTTLKLLAEGFSDMGTPVFMCDVKGDLQGIARNYPTVFWDIYHTGGIPVRTTVSEMGPVLLAKLMGLTETQSEILTVLFKIADDENLLLVDTKDLKAMLRMITENREEYAAEYGNMPTQSINSILRNVVALEAVGGDKFFGEPALNIADWFTVSPEGKGVINILDCRALINDATLYSTFLLWMLSELFETLPEVGDPERPRMVFFFDEAHLIFKDMNKALKTKIEQVVKLIRSKGVGVFFISQAPGDIPNEVLAQLGGKIQHGLRAYTPAEEKKVKTVASTMRANPAFDTYDTLLALGTGETLVSLLGGDGVPSVTEKVKIDLPSTAGAEITPDEREKLILGNNLYLKYRAGVETDSAYEFLERLNQQRTLEEENERAAAEKEKAEYARDRNAQRTVRRVANTAAGTVGRQVGRTIGKTVGGSFGKTLGGNIGAELARSILGTFLK